MDLTEFLRARIAEDEEQARIAQEDQGPSDTYERPWVAALGSFADQTASRVEISPARALAECEAKRRIVELHHDLGNGAGDVGDKFDAADDSTWHVCAQCGDGVYETWPCGTLQLLALPYADHPDYDPKWRP